VDVIKRYLTEAAAERLTELLGGIEITPRKLVNWRYARRGPEVEYLNGQPIYSEPGLQRFVHEALEPQPPVRYRQPTRERVA
jgi:hypothetical protein